MNSQIKIKCNISSGSDEAKAALQGDNNILFVITSAVHSAEQGLFIHAKQYASVDIIMNTPDQINGCEKRYIHTTFSPGIYTVTLDPLTPVSACKRVLLKELFLIYLHMIGWLSFEYTKNGILCLWKGRSFSTRLMPENEWPWIVKFDKWYDSL